VVTTAQRQEFVVRIHRAGESGLQDEAWALAAVRAVGVPVPDVLLVDRLVDKEQSLEYMVQTKVPGRSLAELQRALTPQEWEHALLQMGGMLARVHTVRTGGFYQCQREGVWDFPTRSGLMASVVQDRAARWLRGQG
jgi:aminoglycoside phosphotransferase